MTQHQTAALAYLSGRPLTPVADLALRAVVVLVKWGEIRRTRRALSRLDGHLVRDIGLTEQEARSEADRPFWDCPEYWHAKR